MFILLNKVVWFIMAIGMSIGGYHEPLKTYIRPTISTEVASANAELMVMAEVECKKRVLEQHNKFGKHSVDARSFGTYVSGNERVFIKIGVRDPYDDGYSMNRCYVDLEENSIEVGAKRYTIK